MDGLLCHYNQSLNFGRIQLTGTKTHHGQFNFEHLLYYPLVSQLGITYN